MAKWFIVSVVGVCGWLSPVAPLHAQVPSDDRNPHLTAAYVVNAPQQMVGVGVLSMLPALAGWGLYADAKFALDSPRRQDFLRSVTPVEAEELGDVFARRADAWTTVNLAAVRGITRELAFYLGAGISRQAVYAQYLDETQTRGDNGVYWVEEEAESRNHMNVLGGAFFRMAPRVRFQFGAEAAPAGVTVGVHLRLW